MDRRRKIWVVFMTAMLILLFLHPMIDASARSTLATAVGGNISANTTWTKSNSPYQVQSSVTVLPGVTLTIEPGVEVIFANNTRMVVNGTLLAVGQPGDGIVFTPLNKTPGIWQGVWMSGVGGQRTTGNRIEYVTIEYAGGGIANGANLYLSNADVTIGHSIIRNGSENGLTAWTSVAARVYDTEFTGNAGYAARFFDEDTDPQLSHLTASGNGFDAVGLGDIGQPLTGQVVWESMGLPFVVNGMVSVAANGQLLVQPGVEVRFANQARLDINGKLTASGTPEAPIRFTSVSPVPGAWDGIIFSGPANAFATGDFHYATVEYGGGGGTYGANIYVLRGQVTIDHSIIRNSLVDGVRLHYFSSKSSIQASQVTGNAGYGVRNTDLYAPFTVVASNNWWGYDSGPRSDTICNPGAQGDRVSQNVIFQPFLSDGAADPGLVPTTSAFTLSISPHRWYAPANNTPLYIDIYVYDGQGRPASGRKVSLTTSLGTVEVGPTTDPSGKTVAILRASGPGDAELVATLGDLNACESARSQTASITFTAAPKDYEAMMNPLSPYANTSLSIDPMPVTVGVPTHIRATLTNPFTYDISVDAIFGFAQLGIGLVFGPAGEVYNFIVPAGTTKVMEVDWIPPISGHYCIRLEGTVYKVSTSSPQARLANTSLFSFLTSLNMDSLAAALMPFAPKDILQTSMLAQNAISDGDFLRTVLFERAELPMGLLQDQMFGNILGFINSAGGAINCALAGGTNCGGWSGPSLQLPGGTFGSLSSDPPRQDYRLLAAPETLNVPTLQPGPEMPAARADALNAFMQASARLATIEIATVLTYDRYAGATQAKDSTWSAIQSNAYVTYLSQTGQAMLDYQSAIVALIAEIKSEGYTDLILRQSDVVDFQNRLSTQGWNDTERQAAAVAGMTPEGLELLRQYYIAADPAAAAGSVLDRLQSKADFFGRIGSMILHPPAFGYTIGTRGGLTRSAVESGSSLVKTFSTQETIQIGNPTAQTATINLKVRQFSLPSDWVITLSQESLTLEPGAQAPVTVTIQPGLPLVQGTQPVLAVEGYIGSELIGGVEIHVPAPTYVDFTMPFRMNIPLINKQ